MSAADHRHGAHGTVDISRTAVRPRLRGCRRLRVPQPSVRPACPCAFRCWNHLAGTGDRRFAWCSYLYLMYVRRIHALVTRGEPVAPARSVSGEQYDLDCEEVDDETVMFDSHLLCHSDRDGYHVPVDFDEPLFRPAEANVDGGGMVGSSRRLQAELVAIASALGIQLSGVHVGVDVDVEDALSAAEAVKLADPASADPFEPERFAWRQLYSACRVSIAGGRPSYSAAGAGPGTRRRPRRRPRGLAHQPDRRDHPGRWNGPGRAAPVEQPHRSRRA
jgi:hypothetical protein